jgi:hypothetical protein
MVAVGRMLQDSEGIKEMLQYRTRINNEASHRSYDDNGFLTVDKSPILSTDVLQYLGKEFVIDEVAGVKIDPDKIYKVRIPREELEKAAKSFELLPIVDGHKWLSGGLDDGDAKKYQEGTTGSGAYVDDDGKLFVPLKFTGKGILEHLKDGVEELSASYSHDLRLDDTGQADFVAVNITGNHVALVERGRCGSGVRVFNNDEVEQMKTKNEIALLVDGKKIDLAKFFAEEQKEEAHQDGSISENDGEIDKRAVIDEIGGILKDKGLDEEIIRTVIGLAEKLSYDKSEAGTSDNECETENEDGKEKAPAEGEELPKQKAENAAMLISALKKEMAENNAALRRAYNSAVALTGEDFPAIGLSVRQIYEHALKSRKIETSNRSVAELAAICETLKSVRVDNSFTPSTSATVAEDEVEINI